MRLLSAVVPVLALVLAGCAGSTTAVDGLPADAVVLSAVDASTDTAGVRVRFTTSTTDDSGAEFSVGSGEGVFTDGAAAMTFTFEGGRSFGGQLTYETRIVDGVMYLRLPEGSPFPMPDVDAEWVATDLTEDGGTGLAAFEQFDFRSMLEALRDAAELERDGTEEVAGVATTRFTGSAPLGELLRAQGSAVDDGELEEPLGGSYSDDELAALMPISVWIDGDGLVRRIDLTMDQGSMSSTSSMTVLEYGVEETIEAPPAQDIVHAEEFESEMAEQSASTFDQEGIEGPVFGSDGGSTECETHTEDGVTTRSCTSSSQGSGTVELVPTPQPSPAG